MKSYALCMAKNIQQLNKQNVRLKAKTAECKLCLVCLCDKVVHAHAGIWLTSQIQLFSDWRLDSGKEPQSSVLRTLAVSVSAAESENAQKHTLSLS